MRELRAGISGWQFAAWRGTFYPRGLKQSKELEHAARELKILEINSTFYRLQRPDLFLRWSAQTPDDFLFTIKAPRFITHIRKLRDVEEPVERFLSSGVLQLGPKLGALIWQLPPSSVFEPAVVRDFFSLLRGAALHTDETGSLSKGRLKHAMEVRNASFVDDRFYDLCREYGISVVIAENIHGWPCIERMTSDLVYLRLHGYVEMQNAGYDAQALGHWARKILAWHQPSAECPGGRDVFCFFDGPDVKERAPADAMALQRMLDELRSL